MDQITGINKKPKQKHTVFLNSGKKFDLYLEFKPMQLGWFLRIVYESFELNSVRVVSSPNILHQFKNIVPFGLACFVDENQEPMLIEDFESGRANLYVLPKEDVEAFEDFLSGQA